MHRFDLDRIGEGLVVSRAVDPLSEAAKSGAMVVTAPPGTGKTTFVPPLVANLTPSGGRVLLSQPRRVAVRAAARRIAELDGSTVGTRVGFSVRGERRVSETARIEALTPGVLIRRLLTDPDLSGIGAVILDEVHERSLDGDLLLGMLAELRQLRDDLLVVAMSATLDATLISEVLGGAPVVHVPSALHPLELDYRPFDGARLGIRGVGRDYLDHLARVALSEQAAAGCDALVFVPGAREVDETVRLIREATPVGADAVEVLPLHGRVSSRDQDRAVRGRTGADAPRIIVSTSLAESSLTVPGVRLVVDSGLSREVRRDRARDMTGLVTVSASRASAEQRAGRAARTGPGRAVRVFSEADLGRMPATSPPEITGADLCDAALLLAVWGAPGGRGMPLPTPPPEADMRDAVETLRSLQLVDHDGHPTAAGREVATMPVGVREARALLEGAALLGDRRIPAEVVAAISDDHRASNASLTQLLRDLRSGRHAGAKRWRREADRLERLIGNAHGQEFPVQPLQADKGEAPGAILALARPERIARRASAHTRIYLLASGTRAALPEGSELGGSEWLAIGEVQRSDGRAADGTGAVVRLAASISEETALSIGRALVDERRSTGIEQGRVRAREERHLGAIVLSSTPVQAIADDTAAAFAEHLRSEGLSALPWGTGAATFRGRLAMLRRELGEPWPAVDDESLMGSIEDWLGPDLARLTPSSSLHELDLVSALRRLLPWPDATAFDALVPEHMDVPSGSRIRIEYPEAPSSIDDALSGPPVVSVKLQELFGLGETPRLVGGRVPVLFHLLSPARRPLAVTDDLASFWNGPYRQVRAEMRGRYPKHPWPEDPWTATATARTKRATARD